MRYLPEERRKEYWMFFLFNIIIAIAIGFVTGFLGSVLGMGVGLSNITGTIYNIAVFIPAIAVAIRRMHDMAAAAGG